jgi:6-phosphogluconolactonase (cycloisomerase 2 family)
MAKSARLIAIAALSAALVSPPLGAGIVVGFEADEDGNRLAGYLLDDNKGTVTPLAGYPRPTGGAGDGLFRIGLLAADRANSRVYAFNNLDSTVSAFAIDPATGRATPLPHSPFPVAISEDAACLAVHPSGSPLIVSESFTARVHSFNVDEDSAVAANGSPFTAAAGSLISCVFTPDGKHYYVGGGSAGSSRIAGFAVDAASGVLTPVPGSPFESGATAPNAYAADATRVFVANGIGNQVRVFVRDPATGSLQAASGNPFASGLASNSHQAVLHPNGFYYVAAALIDRVGGFRVQGQGTATQLAASPGSPFPIGGALPAFVSVNRTGRFLVVGDLSDGDLAALRVHQTSGALAPAASLAVNGPGINGLVYLAGADAPPAKPGNLTAQALSSRKVRLTWADTATDELQFLVYGRRGQQPFGFLKMVGKNKTTTTVSNLVAGAQYTFQVRARNTYGESEASKRVAVNLPD